MIIALIQARCGASRLINKVLLDLAGKTVLERVVERVSSCRLIDEVVVVTPFTHDNIPIVRLCAEKNIRVFCGSENDVLDRYYQAAKLIKPDHVIRITADCPVIDPAIIGMVIERHVFSKADYTANIIKETFPDGQDVEVMTYAALEMAWKNARLISEHEHVTPYIRNNPALFVIESVENSVNLNSKRWTLDYPADYEFLVQLYRDLGEKIPMFSMDDILTYLHDHGEIENINNTITRNEGYLKSVANDKEIDKG